MASCSEGCKEEFKRSNFLLTTERPDLFVRSQWTGCACSSIFYLVWRAVSAVTLIIMLGVQVATYAGNEGPRYFVFLTNWSFLLLTIDSIIQLVVSGLAYSKYRETQLWEKALPTTPWYIKMMWVITNITSCAAIVITIVYWLLLYEGQYIEAANFFVHAFNSIYVILNLFITGVPVRIYHYYHCLIYGVVYIIFNAVYVIITDDVIYSVMDWVNDAPSAALYGVLLTVVGSLIIWLVYYGLYRLRLFIFERTNRNDVHPEVKTEEGREGYENKAYEEEHM